MLVPGVILTVGPTARGYANSSLVLELAKTFTEEVGETLETCYMFAVCIAF